LFVNREAGEASVQNDSRVSRRADDNDGLRFRSSFFGFLFRPEASLVVVADKVRVSRNEEETVSRSALAERCIGGGDAPL